MWDIGTLLCPSEPPGRTALLAQDDELQSIAEFIADHDLTLAGDDGRLRYGMSTLGWWSGVGCELCYIETRTVAEHSLQQCQRSKYSTRARAILSWLESMDIPVTTCGGPVSCSICTILEYPGSTKPLVCEWAAIMKRVIAALCAYDSQFLGRYLLTLIPEGKLCDEPMVRKWMQRQLEYKVTSFPRRAEPVRYPGILNAYEKLVRAFYYRENVKHGAAVPEVNFPSYPPKRLDDGGDYEGYW